LENVRFQEILRLEKKASMALSEIDAARIGDRFLKSSL